MNQSQEVEVSSSSFWSSCHDSRSSELWLLYLATVKLPLLAWRNLPDKDSTLWLSVESPTMQFAVVDLDWKIPGGRNVPASGILHDMDRESWCFSP